MCGSCHDIDSPAGGHIERTFKEWSASAFPTPGQGSDVQHPAVSHDGAAPVGDPDRDGRSEALVPRAQLPAVDIPLETNVDMPRAARPHSTAAIPAATTAVQNALNGNALPGALCVTADGRHPRDRSTPRASATTGRAAPRRTGARGPRSSRTTPTAA